MRKDIVIVGGYGGVGQYVTRELAKTCPENIVVAGRSLGKAKDFVETVNREIRIMELDIYNLGNCGQKFNTCHTVVMCLEPKNMTFAEFCINSGVNYIDISASTKISSQIKELEDKATKNNATCVLGVGIAPGLSTMLAKTVIDKSKHVDGLNLTLMLGLGEPYGQDGVKWFLDNLMTDFNSNGKSRTFIKKFKTDFPEPLRQRTSYHFNLADRKIISQTLGVENINTYFCYDSKLMTNLVHFLKKTGILNLLRRPRIYNLFLNIFSSTMMSKNKSLSNTFSINVTVFDKTNTHQGSIIGYDSQYSTGIVAAFVANKLCKESYPAGTYYLNELMSLDEVVTGLKDNLTLEIY